jgi:6-pyruvoyltetrahydropterin/6-carboxytetrahydropterin synthase
MRTVTRLIHFCYGHRLLNYSGKCRQLHGHNGKLEVTMRKDSLNELGMVMDFEDIKLTVQKWVDTELDHKTLLNEKDPMVKVLRDMGEPIVTIKGNPTAENIAQLIFDYAKGQKLPIVNVRIWETVNSYAEYGE